MYKLPERDQFNLFQMGKFNSKFEQLELFPEIDYIRNSKLHYTKI